MKVIFEKNLFCNGKSYEKGKRYSVKDDDLKPFASNDYTVIKGKNDKKSTKEKDVVNKQISEAPSDKAL